MIIIFEIALGATDMNAYSISTKRIKSSQMLIGHNLNVGESHSEQGIVAKA